MTNRNGPFFLSCIVSGCGWGIRGFFLIFPIAASTLKKFHLQFSTPVNGARSNSTKGVNIQSLRWAPELFYSPNISHRGIILLLTSTLLINELYNKIYFVQLLVCFLGLMQNALAQWEELQSWDGKTDKKHTHSRSSTGHSTKGVRIQNKLIAFHRCMLRCLWNQIKEISWGNGYKWHICTVCFSRDHLGSVFPPFPITNWRRVKEFSLPQAILQLTQWSFSAYRWAES